MDLPCIGPKLKGDYEPPFTCGGETRRSIIKRFVRDHINEGKEANNGNTHTETLIRERIQELRVAWSDISRYFILQGCGYFAPVYDIPIPCFVECQGQPCA